MTEERMPARLSPRAKRVWRSLTAQLAFDPHEAAILIEVCRTISRLDGLENALRKVGPVTPDGRPSPLLAETRLLGVTLARLTTALRLPDDLSRPERRGQRRGTRGIYRLYDEERTA